LAEAAKPFAEMLRDCVDFTGNFQGGALQGCNKWFAFNIGARRNAKNLVPK
jgi:hypothetical protein